MKILPFLLIIIVFLGANFFVFYRLWHIMPPTTIGRGLLITFAVIVVSSIFTYFLVRDAMPPALASCVYAVGTSWIFIFLYLLMTILVVDLVRITHLLPIDRFLSGNWIGFGSIVGFVAIVMIIGNIRYNNKTRVELSLDTHKEALAEQPLKIVAISDMHLGYGIGKEEFRKWTKLINRENPDLVLIAGDIIDFAVRPLIDQHMEDVFSEIKSKYGIYASAGNHEYIADIRQSLNFINKTNVKLLRDSVALIDDRFYVVGRDDRMNSHRKTLEELTASLDHSKPIIVLDHQPYHLEEVEANNVDLQVSGHTHRGQVWPINWVTDMIYEVSHGYKKKGDSHIYVSSGIGIWGGKFRIGSQSEYVVIELR